MPGKKKVPSSRREVIRNAALATALGVVAYGCYIWGAVGGLNTQASLSRMDFQNRLRQEKLQLLYDTTKAAAAGVRQDTASLENYYARVLTPDLHARFKKDGPTVLFCSSKLPDLMSFRPLGGNDNFIVNEEFFLGTGQESVTQHAIVEFAPSRDYVSTNAMGMPDYKEMVSKIACQ